MWNSGTVAAAVASISPQPHLLHRHHHRLHLPKAKLRRCFSSPFCDFLPFMAHARSAEVAETDSKTSTSKVFDMETTTTHWLTAGPAPLLSRSRDWLPLPSCSLSSLAVHYRIANLNSSHLSLIILFTGLCKNNNEPLKDKPILINIFLCF